MLASVLAWRAWRFKRLLRTGKVLWTLLRMYAKIGVSAGTTSCAILSSELIVLPALRALPIFQAPQTQVMLTLL